MTIKPLMQTSFPLDWTSLKTIAPTFLKPNSHRGPGYHFRNKKKKKIYITEVTEANEFSQHTFKNTVLHIKSVRDYSEVLKSKVAPRAREVHTRQKRGMGRS